MDKAAASPREVVARYYESLWPDDDLTWIQYVQDRANVSPAERGEGDQPSIYNPYDFTDPGDKPKDLKYGGPFSQRYDEMDAEYGVSYPPNIYYDEDSVMKDWYKARHRDWTDDPSEQQPAISIDRKYASMEREAATLSDVIRADDHYLKDRKFKRADAVKVSLVGATEDSMLKGRFEFTWVNKTPMATRPTVTFQFLRPRGRERPSSYLDYPVQLSCNCASFLYWGAQYYAVHGKYMFMPGFRPSLVPPVPQDMISSRKGGRNNPGRGLNFRVCKHIIACYRWFEDQIRAKKIRTLMHYRRYPPVGPPAKVMNAKEWERLMGFPFTLEEIKRRLSAPKPVLPRFYSTQFFRSREQSGQLEDWFKDTWLYRDEPEKMRILETLVEHPEEIFYLMVKDALEAPKKLSPAAIEKAYDLMSKVVQPEAELEPEGPDFKIPGTGVIIPPEEDLARQIAKRRRPTYKVKYEPGIKPVTPAIKRTLDELRPFSKKRQREVAKKIRPWLKRDAIDNVVSKFLRMSAC